MTRRGFTLAALAAALLGLSRTGRTDPGPRAPEPMNEVETGQTLEQARTGRALSTRVLQEAWSACAGNGLCPAGRRDFGGLRRVTGFLIDRENADVVILGKVDPARPPLVSEDFAVALRNAMHVYAERKGNTLIYRAPSVSIDPRPEVMRQLDLAGQLLHRATAGREVDALEAWKRSCTAPMAVRVMGMPFDSHFAWTAVKADYDAKRLLDGSDRLRVAGFDSVLDRKMARVVNTIRAGGRGAVPGASINRIWFAAGELRLLEDQGAMLIGAGFGVTVKTEAELMRRQGDLVGTGTTDPTVEAWARDFSAQYHEIARQRPVYAELEGLFRLFALARVLAEKRAFDVAGLSPQWLLHGAPIPRVPVAREVAGCFNVKRHDERRAVPGGEERYSVVMPSCGGVGFGVPIEAGSVTAERGGMLRRVGAKVRAARRDPRALYWDY